MADAVDAPEKRSRDYQSNLGSVDPNLERILWHLEDDCKKNVIEELIFDFDLEELNAARDTIFNTLTTNGDPRVSNGGRRKNEVATSDQSRPIAVPWIPIKRRSEILAADDICELYMYYMDDGKDFPTKMHKRQAIRASMIESEADKEDLGVTLDQDDEKRVVDLSVCPPHRNALLRETEPTDINEDTQSASMLSKLDLGGDSEESVNLHDTPTDRPADLNIRSGNPEGQLNTSEATTDIIEGCTDQSIVAMIESGILVHMNLDTTLEPPNSDPDEEITDCPAPEPMFTTEAVPQRPSHLGVEDESVVPDPTSPDETAICSHNETPQTMGAMPSEKAPQPDLVVNESQGTPLPAEVVLKSASRSSTVWHVGIS